MSKLLSDLIGRDCFVWFELFYLWTHVKKETGKKRYFATWEEVELHLYYILILSITCGFLQVSNLFARDEIDEITQELIGVMKKEYPKRPPTNENLYDYFLTRVKSNLHVVLCFSPVRKCVF